jgi:hypothetical protein
MHALMRLYKVFVLARQEEAIAQKCIASGCCCIWHEIDNNPQLSFSWPCIHGSQVALWNLSFCILRILTLLGFRVKVYCSIGLSFFLVLRKSAENPLTLFLTTVSKDFMPAQKSGGN